MLWQLGHRGLVAVLGLMLVAGCEVTQPTSAPTTTAPYPSTTEPTTTTTVLPPGPTPAPAPPTPTPASAPAPAFAAALPNPALTPGEALPGVTRAQVCQVGWASSHRDVPEAERYAVFAAYGVPYGQRGSYELDHLIPLELGGDNAQANLWPEPHDSAGTPGSQTKDGLENRLHELVCAGQVDLATAQHAIATNWQTALVRYGS
jgi:hypothetical protein